MGGTSSYQLTLEPGDFQIEGQHVLVDHEIDLDSEQFPLTGQDVVLHVTRLMPIAVGSFGLVGQAVNLSITKLFEMEQGAFALTGFDVSLRRGEVRTLTMLTGSYAVTGQPVVLSRSRRLYCEAGSYSVLDGSLNLAKSERQHYIVPYLIGSTLDLALQMIESIHCTAQVSGSSGTVTAQSPVHMSLVLKDTNIFITLGGAVVKPASPRSLGLPPYNSQEGLR